MYLDKGSLTLKSCNTSFQTELVYRLSAHHQKTWILLPLGWGWEGTGQLLVMGQLLKREKLCNYRF
uniref:Uncharacterized protein n=1 Tax=Xenopus tropicalis TaxID=8364 RepID=A0A6I8Q053_XENTR